MPTSFRKSLILILVFALLCATTLQQRGGGGGRSSGGGGSRGSSSSRSSSYSRSQSCSTKCGANSACLEECNRSSGMGGAIAAGVVGGVGGIAGLCACCRFCRRRNESEVEDEEDRQTKFEQLEQKYNQVNTMAMPLEEFEGKRNEIIYWLNNKGAEVPSNFAYIQKGVPTPVVVEARILNNEDFKTQIELRGNDEVGSWTAKGYILCNIRGEIFMWFSKDYDDKESAGQTGAWSDLIYESTQLFPGVSLEGRWFYVGYESDSPSNDYAGRWLIINGQTQNNFYSVPCQWINQMQH